MSNIFKNYTDTHELQEYWIQNIAPKYFNVNNDMNMRIGLYGYINSILSDISVDSINVMSSLYKEIFPNLAELPESQLTYAALSKISNINAVPARLQAIIGIPEDVLQMNLNYVNGVGEYTISKDTLIEVDGLEFGLEYPIRISSKQLGQEVAYTALYELNHHNPISNVTIPYLKITRMDKDGSKYVFISVILRQIHREYQFKKIIDNNIIDIISNRFRYSGMLADFNVYYKEAQSDKYIQIKKILYDDTYLDEPFCYYSYTSDNEVEIKFSAKTGYFRPQYNSEIMIEFITTRGTKGMFTQTHHVFTVAPDESNSDINMICIPITGSEGGIDKRTVDELKRANSEAFSARGNISSATDLKNYFNDIQGNDKMEFIKTRDDVLAREFAAFILMKDFDDNIIPSNTINIIIKEADMVSYPETQKVNIPYNMMTINFPHLLNPYSVDGKKYASLMNGTSLSNSQINNYEANGFLYQMPFLTIINKNPLSVSYYISNINKKTMLDLSYVNQSSIVQFISSAMTVYRNDFINPLKYQVGIKLKETNSTKTITFTKDGDIITGITDDMLRVYAIVYDGTNAMGYMKLNFSGYDIDSEEISFNKTIDTTDYITDESKVKIKSGFFPINSMATDVDTNILIKYNDLRVVICTFVKYSGESYGLNGIDAMIPGLDGYTLTNLYETLPDNGLDVLINVNDIIKSRITVRNAGLNGEPGVHYYIKSVPVLRYTYALDLASFNYVVNTIRLKRLYLKEAIKVLTNNFGIDFKFFNTYGLSHHYNIGVYGERLNKVNLRIEFKIRLISKDDAGVLAKIRIFIKEYIEKINNSIDNHIYVSNLIRAIENSFAEVKFIEFVGLNNYPTTMQVIENNITSNTVLDVDYVPEFININNIMTNGRWEPEIILTLV